jgi:hypothetical protein
MLIETTKWELHEGWVRIDPMDGSPDFYLDEDTGERMDIEFQDGETGEFLVWDEEAGELVPIRT